MGLLFRLPMTSVAGEKDAVLAGFRTRSREISSNFRHYQAKQAETGSQLTASTWKSSAIIPTPTSAPLRHGQGSVGTARTRRNSLRVTRGAGKSYELGSGLID
jgi:hypothetical protein